MKKIVLIWFLLFSLFWVSKVFANDYTINLNTLNWENLQDKHTFAQGDSIKFINAWTGLYYSRYNWTNILPWYNLNNNDVIYIYAYDCYAWDFCIVVNTWSTYSWQVMNQTSFISNLNVNNTNTWTIQNTNSWSNYTYSWWLNNLFRDIDVSTYDPINQNLVEIKILLIILWFFVLLLIFYFFIQDLLWKK